MKLMEAKEVLFAEWLGQNHYRLCNVNKDFCYWESESDEDEEQTTQELLIKYINQNEN